MGEEEKNPAWGGKRDGAGRKPSGRKARCIALSDEEYEAVKEFVNQLREAENNGNH